MSMSNPEIPELHKFKAELNKLRLKASILIVGINTIDPSLKHSFERIRDAIMDAEEDIQTRVKNR